MDQKKIKIILVEDHHSARQAYAECLEKEYNFFVIGQASNGLELLGLISKNIPDIVLLDLEMPVLNGYNTLPILKMQFPSIKTIILSTHNEAYLATHMLQNGANSYLPKNCEMKDVVQAINKVYDEGFFFDELISRLLIDDFLKTNDLPLSDREISVLRLFCKGKPYKVISEELFISLNTVKFHLKNIYKKTEMESVAGLIKYAIKKGITELN
jgi:DNA-binding NarL/FixJ family response regulator